VCPTSGLTCVYSHCGHLCDSVFLIVHAIAKFYCLSARYVLFSLFLWIFSFDPCSTSGARGSVVGWDTMLRAGRSRDRIPMWWIFQKLPNPSSRTMAPRATQPLTEMSTRNLPGGKGRSVHRADNLTDRHLWAFCLRNVGTSTSHNPIGLHGLWQG
jgi:hypothetical protein